MAYSPEQKEEIFNTVFQEICNGRALRKILKDEGMPDYVTFYKWLEEDDEKIKQYARATEIRADHIFDEILDISDAAENDVLYDEDGREIINHNVIQRDRLRVDSRKWIASKLAPKKYGDSSKLTLDGGLKATITSIQRTVIDDTAD